MHAKIPASFGVELLLEIFVLWIIRRPICYDENRLKGETQTPDVKISDST